ncbi:bifunctional riboflavin kinase/FAD synthetase [Algivirga pacifica]|uniref:Riboflavin biosynthesis protein n=1 Tax=Algivirga pacifica TaxID=1162670 RepID=A0ABP9D4A3_9BACT
MKVYRSIEEFIPPPKTVVTSGTFDGVHFGHQQILKQITTAAREEGAETVMITYWPHPRFVLFDDPQKHPKLLTTLEEKIKLLEQNGLDHLIVLEFNKEFSKLTSMEFIQHILIDGIQTNKLVIGYDHKFGRNQEGSFDYLKEHAPSFGFEVEEIPKQELEEVAVSSTKIREALHQGDVKRANKYLRYRYMIHGTVTDGNKLGRKIGFPTANIKVDVDYKLIPKNGTYAVEVEINQKRYMGMLNIGNKPTVTDGSQKTIEVNIFHFNENIYGEEISVRFVDFLRNEQKFSNVDELIHQLSIDKQNTLQLFQS